MIDPGRFTRRSALALAAIAAALVTRSRARAVPLPTAPLTAWPARTLADAIAARRISAVEVMTAFLDRIEAVNPRVNAIIALQDRAGLLRQAEQADRAFAGGRGARPGVLHGLPHAVKDLEAVAGLPFTQGSPIFKNQVATHDDLPVERMRRAGALFIGKTNTPEFGLGSHTYNPVWGTTRNPYDLSRSAGGSSGGAAVALALDMVPLADGSDYGGSLRNPAGWNNVFGFRTSIGRVPTDGHDVWLPSPGVVGPMARNVGDLALLLSVLAGWDPRAPLSMESGGEAFRAIEPEAMKGKRIAWSGDFGGHVPYEAGLLDVTRRALGRFEAMGAIVEDAVPDYPIDKAWDAFVRIRQWRIGAAMVALYRDPARRALLKPEAVWEVEGGMALSAFDISAWSAVQTEWSRAVARLFERFDYWIVPTAQVFPFPAEWHWPREIAGHAMATYHEWMKGVCLVTAAGCPSLAVPAGFSDNGLPIGLQIIAPVHHEAACLAAAAAWETAIAPVLARKPALA